MAVCQFVRDVWDTGKEKYLRPMFALDYTGIESTVQFTGYLPGAAAPGIDVPSWCTVLVCPFLQPIGLVVYESLKKSICRVRLFSSRFLKQFMDWASTSSCAIYSIYWWPSGKRSTNVNHSDNASSPISKCALWLKCLRPFWKNVTKEWKTVPSSVWITRSSQLCSFFLPGTTVPTDVTWFHMVMVWGGEKSV